MPQDPANAEAFAEWLDTFIPQYLNEFHVPGAAVALIEKGEVVFAKGYGHSDLAKRLPVTSQTRFDLCSVSKTVTAWSAMKLAEEGKINLDAPIEDYITRWSLPESEFDSRGVTVRRLLSHTGGLSQHSVPGPGPGRETMTLEESLSAATGEGEAVRLIMEPGTQWKYSGGGYTLLQLLVEEVTERTFANYVTEELLSPLGMKHASYEPDGVVDTSYAHDELGESIPRVRSVAHGAAGLYSSVEEFAKIVAAGLPNVDGLAPRHEILKSENVARMMEPAPATSGKHGLGYQLSKVGKQKRLLAGHGGSNHGWRVMFQTFPSQGDGFVALTNSSNGGSLNNRVFYDWIEWKTGRKFPLKKSVAVALVGSLQREGIDAALAYYARLKNEQKDEYRFNEWELNRLGVALLKKDRLPEAIAIFKLNISEYPEAANPYDSLGAAYKAAGQIELAIENYRRTLEIDPNNPNAVRILQELKEQLRND